MTDEPTHVEYDGRTVRLKWHKLRRLADDPPFARVNLRAGLAAGASMEVDIRALACGHFVCLHDPELESETTSGLVARIIDAFLDSSARDLAALRAAVGARDHQALGTVAHRLKGACGDVGAVGLVALCQQLEQSAGVGDPARAGAFVDRIESELGRVRAALEAIPAPSRSAVPDIRGA